MAKKPESRLQRRIRDALEKAVGGWWFKVHGGPFQQAGIPDLIGCVRGLFFALEVKRPMEGTPSQIQLETIKDIKYVGGGIAAIVTSPAEAIAIVETALALSARRGLEVLGRSPSVLVLRTADRQDLRNLGDTRSTRAGRRAARRAAYQHRKHLVYQAD